MFTKLRSTVIASAVCALVFAILVAPAVSGGRGGNVQKFDPNLLGGGWTCFRTQASGACGSGTFAQYFDASCIGVSGQSADDTALAAWITYGIAQAAAPAKLYVPPGSDCWFTQGSRLTTTTHGSSGIQNATIWGYDATFNQAPPASHGFIDVAYIQSATAGSTTVQLATASDVSKFSVGRWVMLEADGLQDFGDPGNFQLFEYRLITSISGSAGSPPVIITLNSPLANTYLSTYPDTGVRGPAALSLLEPNWNVNLTIYGLTFASFGFNGGQAIIQGRIVQLNDVVFAATADNPAPTVSTGIWFNRGTVQSPENDKSVAYLSYNGVNGGALFTQSGSVGTLVIANSRFRGSAAGGPGINGTAFDTTITNTISNSIKAGPCCYGVASSLTLDGVTFASATTNYHFLSASSLSFSGGTFSIANASAAGVYAVFVPGHKYFFGDTDGSNTCSPVSTTFTVTALRQDASNTHVDIGSCSWGSCSGSLPTVTCAAGARNYSTYGAYQLMSLTQRNSGPGNLLANPEILPP